MWATQRLIPGQHKASQWRWTGSSPPHLRFALLSAVHDACLPHGYVHHASIIWPLIQRGVADVRIHSRFHGAKGADSRSAQDWRADTIEPWRWLICSKQPTQKACKHVITQAQTHMCRAVSEQHLHNNFTHWCLSHQGSMKHSSTDGHQFWAHMSSRTRTQFATRFKSCFATAPPRNPKKAPVPQ